MLEVNRQDNAFINSVYSGNLELVKYLMEQENIPTEWDNSDRKDALDLSILKSFNHITEYLMDFFDQN